MNAPRPLDLDGPLVWKNHGTWVGRLTKWLGPFLKPDGLGRLEGAGEQNLCWDDSDWRTELLASALAVDEVSVAETLAAALSDVTARVYHGCRVDDAGVFHREGLRLNDPARLENEARLLVAESPQLQWMQADIEQRITAFAHRDRDTARVYACLDDRLQLDDTGHYALYGSEWLQAFFSFNGFRALRSRGVPTILEINLPLAQVRDGTTRELATALLQEWTRVIVDKPDWSPTINFGITLLEAIPARWVVDHYHPKSLNCPYEGRAFVSAVTVCPACAGREGRSPD